MKWKSGLLKGTGFTPILRIVYESADSSDVIKAIMVNAGKAAMGNIASVKLFYTGSDTLFYKDKVRQGS
jgi:hypothetical protein